MFNFFNKKSKRGFTLTEMLVIILIITIVVAIATPIYKKVVMKAHAAEAINLLMLVRTKQAQNYARKNSYFKTFGEMSGNLTSSSEVRDANNSSLLKVDNYDVELSGENDCVVASYKPANSDTEEFSFSISYLRNGLGCDGEICSSFGDVIGDVETVCQRPLEVESKCPDFNPRSCSYPYVVSLEGCYCECSDAARIACSKKQDSTWYEDSCYCDFPCEPTDHPEIGNNNWFWDADGCEWACGITEANCGERESYNSSTCKCDCLYGTDSNGNCACPSGQIWDGAHCSGCAYQSYTLQDGSSVCCTEEAPLVIEGECSACPPKSQWDPELKICACDNVVDGVCQCPDETPMWTGLECVSCSYQSYHVTGEVYECCTEARPMVRNNECVACPANSTWNATRQKCVCNTGFTPVYEGGVLSSCTCHVGTSESYTGANSGFGNCKCPSNTTPTNRGGQVAPGSICRCPEGMQWVTVTQGGIDGGYCSCSLTNRSTRLKTGLQGFTIIHHSVGIACCPEGTAGYVFDTVSTQTSGYTGAVAVGVTREQNSNVADACFCPAYAGPKDSSDYQGEAANATCNCETGRIWNGSACVANCQTEAGTSGSFLGPLVSTGSACRCPANTSPNYSGGAVSNGNCRCPEGTEWQPNANSVNGGYCKCVLANRVTRFTNVYGDNHQTASETGCCPEGTRGYKMNTSYVVQDNYNGGVVIGTSYGSNSMIADACHCPTTNTGPSGSSAYQGDVVNASCSCKTGMRWNGSACVSNCLTGTSIDYSGPAISTGNVCKCPINTSPNYQGGAIWYGACKCPEGSSWVNAYSSLWKDGGYCECTLANRTTRFLRSGTGPYRIDTSAGCCPEGTVGYALDTTNYPPAKAQSGYEGAEAIGGCFCPTGTGPKSNSAYQGSSVNATCACPTGTNWYNAQGSYAAGCYRCPFGSTWNDVYELCVCNNGYGSYDETNACTVNLCNAPGAYYNPAAGQTRCGCLPENTEWSPSLNCCYCPSQAGAGHDALHDSRGCYIGS